MGKFRSAAAGNRTRPDRWRRKRPVPASPRWPTRCGPRSSRDPAQGRGRLQVYPITVGRWPSRSSCDDFMRRSRQLRGPTLVRRPQTTLWSKGAALSRRPGAESTRP